MTDYIIAISCFLITVLVFLPSNYIVKRRSGKTSKPFGTTLFYTDQKHTIRRSGVIYSELLFSPKYGVQGKPDYIYKTISGNFLPVELKSGEIKSSNMPNDGDLLQLAAYFLIIEDIYGRRPKKGKIIYSDYSFIIRNTKHLRKCINDALFSMRTMLATGEGHANADFPVCRHCLCRGTVCDYCE